MLSCVSVGPESQKENKSITLELRFETGRHPQASAPSSLVLCVITQS